MAIRRDSILAWFQLAASSIHEQRDFLNQLDAAIGDADHGTNMDRGLQAVVAKLPSMQNMDIGSIFKAVGATFVSTIGGASGPLYGTAFLRAGMIAPDKMELTPAEFLLCLRAVVQGMQARGKAQAGEKTMLDVWFPVLDALQQAEEENAPFAQVAMKRVVDAAAEGVQKTIPMLATKGRASYLGERSIGHQDPGATSSWLLLKAL